MGSFYMNEAMFDLPDAGFVDRTVTYLSGLTPRGASVVLLVERRPHPANKSLRQIAAEHGRESMQKLFGYTVLFEREVEVASHPALDVGVRWRADDGEPIYTRRAHLSLGSTWLMIVGEAPSTERELCDTYVDHVVASLRIRD
jgi:hypothetical protein